MIKRMMQFSLMLVSLVMVSFAFANSSTELKGEVNKNIYTNKYFGFNIHFPADWQISSAEEMKAGTREAEKIMFKKDSRGNLQAIRDSGVIKEVQLFAIAKKPFGMPENVLLTGNAIKISALYSGIKSAEQFLEIQKQAFEKISNLKPDYISEITQTKLDGVEFAQRNFVIHISNLVSNTHVYATIRNGFLIMFTMAYARDEDKDVPIQILKTIKFTHKDA